MATKAKAKKAVTKRSKGGLAHRGNSKALKAHTLVQGDAKLRKLEDADLAKELKRRFKVTPNTARNWARDFKAHPIEA